MSVKIGSSFSDREPARRGTSSLRKSVSIEKQNSLKYMTVADLQHQHSVERISSISQERFASGAIHKNPILKRPSGPPDWYLRQQEASNVQSSSNFVSNFVEDEVLVSSCELRPLHLGQLLGLKEEFIVLYERLVKETNLEEKMRLLEEIKNGEPDLRFKVSISKSGQERVYVWLRSSPLGEGAFKSCFMAIKLGGKAPDQVKPSVILQAQGNSASASFKKDAAASIEMSEFIQQLASGSDVGKIFIKYKKLSATDDEAIKAPLANEGDFESQKILMRCRDDAKFRENSMKRLLAAGEFMEKNGISHNDLKLANLLLRQGKLMIADYGLMSVDGSQTILTIGTPGYIPPDIGHFINSSSITDSKHDEFSAGVIFLEMMVGESHVFSYGRPSEAFLNGFLPFANKLEALCEQLAKITPRTAAVEVLVGLLQPYAINRMSFQEAIEKMEGHWGEEQVVLKQVKEALQLVIHKK